MKIRKKYHRFADKIDVDNLRCLKHVRKDKALLSIGTLGGGNHFVEVDKDDDGGRWLIIHTGSRHLGVEVEKFYHDEACSQSSNEIPYELAYLTGSAKDDYLHDMDIVQKFAEINRAAIADEIIKRMKLDVETSLSTIHNYIDIRAGILRKGAVSAKKGEKLIIPMNMRDGALLCVGKGNEDWNFSAPHGAGRLLSRQDTMQLFTLSQFKKEMKGIYSTSISKDTLDESPMAYKSTEQIMSQIGDTVDITQKIVPIYNFKAGREES